MDIQFPYKTKHKITVFGGHPDFIKKIKQFLPDVRFIPYSKSPNTNVIKSSDIIWIQNRALCHATFKVVIENARQSNILVKYFSQSSARECAKELALSDI